MAWQGVYDLIFTAMQAQGLAPEIGLDWPTLNTLQAVTTGALPPTISIFDRGGIKNNTHNVFLSPVLPPDFGTPGASLVISADSLPTGGTVTLTGSGKPLVNDCAFFVTGEAGKNLMSEYIAVVDDLSTVLTQLTAAINANGQCTAMLSGDVITVTNISDAFLPVRAGVVNVGGFTQEIYRQKRDIQVTLWTRTPAERERYGTILENLFAQTELNFGILLADQSWARLMIEDDMVWKDSQLQNIFRRDFIITLDYPVLQFLRAWIVESITDVLEATY
jgi:hypothetical protein